jgi:glycosyltransferase involved in cell wall biosynthesis
VKVILLSNTAAYLRNMWLPLARALRERGADVVMAAPVDADVGALVGDGFRFEPVPLPRGIRWPWNEVRAFVRIVSLYRRERPDVVHHFTAKPIVYGSLAAKVAHVPVRICTVSGLGFVFAKTGALATFSQWLTLGLYRVALRARDSWTIFQNPDDRDLFVRRGVVFADRAGVVRSSGVDTDVFPLSRLPTGVPVVLCAARLIWDKGIGEFVEAAKALRAKGVNARFVLAGWRDAEHPAAIPATIIRAWHDEGVIEYLGHRSEMVGVLSGCTVVVLPSKYREGVPRILVEAASMGRPVVATDVPGCREVCVDGFNGRLVKPGDAIGLAAAIEELLADPAGAERLGRNGRRLAVEAFDLKRVVRQTVTFYTAATATLPSPLSATMQHSP